MSSKNRFYSLEEASEVLATIEKYYPVFYEGSDENLRIFKYKAYSSTNDFWKKLQSDTEEFVSKKFKYSGDRVYQFFKANNTPSNKYVRNFDVEEVECLIELAYIYKTEKYNTETKQPSPKKKKFSLKNYSTKQISYFTIICIVFLIIGIILVSRSCSPDMGDIEKKEKQKPLIDKKVLDTTKIKKDSLPKEINNMNINIQVKDSGKIEQIINFGNVKEVNL